MFGRRREDEDPFAALRKGSTYSSEPSRTVPGIPGSLSDSGGGRASGPSSGARSRRSRATASPGRPPAGPSARPAGLPGAPRARRRFPVRVWLIGIVVLAVALDAIGHSSQPTTQLSISVPSVTLPNLGLGATTTGGGSTGPSTGGGSQGGVTHPASYLSAGGLRAGLREIERLAPGAKLSSVRIDRDSISAYAHLPNGRSKLVGIEPSGSFVTGTPSDGERYFAAALVDPAAVPRILRELKRQYGIAPARIDYMVFNRLSGFAAQWELFIKAPSHPGYTAASDGRDLHKLDS